MNRNRSTTDPVPKQSSIASISSNVSLMATNKDNDIHYSNTDVQSFLNSYKTNTNRDSKRSRTICQPKGTIPYTVGNYDTLEKIALQFNLTPSELLQLNKLNTRVVFPGQVLYVPEASTSITNNEQQISPPFPLISPTSSTKPKDEDTFILLTDRHSSSGSSPPTTQQDVGPMVWSMSRQTTAKPGRAQRLKSEPSTESESLSSTRTIEDRLKIQKEENTKQIKHIPKTFSIDDSQQLDEECLQRFIKVNVRLVTDDHKSVAGTLLVTPNAVMFDPDVLDPLVKEHGIDKYGLIIRMDLLAGIALYEDIAMYEHEATARDEEKRKICHSISLKSLHQYSTILSNNDEEQIRDLISLLVDKIDKEMNTSNDFSVKLFNASSINRHRILSDNNEDLFQTFDDCKHSIGILVDDKDIPSQGCHLENCVPVDEFNKRFGEIDKLLQKQHDIYVTPHPIEIPYYLCIKTSILMNDIAIIQERQNKKHIDNVYGKKDLEHEYWFSVPKEKIDHLYTFFLHWSPERALDPFFDDNHPDDSHILSNTQSKHNEASPSKGFVLLANDDPELTDDYNKNTNSSSKSRTPTTLSDSGIEPKKQHYLKRQNTLLKEWEFSNDITMIRTLSKALSINSSSSTESSPPSNSRRFTLHSLARRLSDSKKVFLEQIPQHQQQLTRLRKRARSLLPSVFIDELEFDRQNSSARIISVDEIYRRINATHANNTHLSYIGIPPPKLLQPSTLIDEDQSKQILLELPARVHGLNWKMTFSTETNGFSLNQLYRRSTDVDQDTPALLIVKDVEQNLFGAYISQQLMISEGFYGTGESFLFTFYPEFRVYHWTGHNQFFVKGDAKSLGIGSGEGTYGLWLDADLYHGRTCPSKTFNNVKLSSKEDFIIASVEVWTFID